MWRKSKVRNFLMATVVLTAIIGTGLIFSTGNMQKARAKNPGNNSKKITEESDSIPVFFESNQGQFDRRVRFMTRGETTLFLTATEAVYLLRNPKSQVPSLLEFQISDFKLKNKNESEISGLKSEIGAEQLIKNKSQKAVALYMTLAGANQNAEFVPSEEAEHRTNYFRGADASRWQTDVPNYRRVSVENIYDGIDMIWQGKTNGEIQYDFVVAPNSDLNQIEWQIEGAKNVSIDNDGDLIIETEAGVMRQRKPLTYQEANDFRTEIESGFVIKENPQSANGNRQSFHIGFGIGEYDHSKSITIDPTMLVGSLPYSTFLGDSNIDQSNAIAVDTAGNAYITGFTQSINFPTTPGTFDTTFNTTFDTFVTKFNPTGTSLLYSTFLGGDASEGTGIAVDASGNAFVTGRALDNFSTTVGAFDTTQNGNFDVFVTKLNSGGSALLYSTYLGGSSIDNGFGIAIDSSGNAYMTGIAVSGNYPTTPGAFDTTFNTNNDVVVSKLNAAGSALVYSTYIGGINVDQAQGIAVDSAGNAFITGFTQSNNYPTTAGAFDTTYNAGNGDVFATKLNATGTALTYSTFIGADGLDRGRGIAIDAAGNAYLTGFTDSATFPTTTGAFDETFNGSNDVFVTKMNATGTGLIYSTFIGGSSEDNGFAIAVDGLENAYFTGRTFGGTPAFPTTAGAFDETHNGNDDAFLSKLNATGTALLNSTFLGGGSGEEGYGISIDSSGNAFVTGIVTSSDYPTTAGAFDETQNGSFDAFVTKVNTAPVSAASVTVGGRVTNVLGRGIGRVRVIMTDSSGETRTAITNSFGYYRITDVFVGESYIFSVFSKSYTFNPNSQIQTIFEATGNINFTAEN
jgi:hypothetical protein